MSVVAKCTRFPLEDTTYLTPRAFDDEATYLTPKPFNSRSTKREAFAGTCSDGTA